MIYMNKTEVESTEIYCPKCKSTRVTTKKEGVSGLKAVDSAI